jgi:hypothetical protein
MPENLLFFFFIFMLDSQKLYRARLRKNKNFFFQHWIGHWEKIVAASDENR